MMRACGRYHTTLRRRTVCAHEQRAAFTLIEIMVVVAIIAMLSSVGAIQLQRARMVTHEQLTLVSMREMMKACQFYYVVRTLFPESLNDMVPPASDPAYVDARLVGNGVSVNLHGYTLTYASPDPPITFTVSANPITHNVTGERHFFMDETFSIYFTKEDRDADPATDQTIP